MPPPVATLVQVPAGITIVPQFVPPSTVTLPAVPPACAPAHVSPLSHATAPNIVGVTALDTKNGGSSTETLVSIEYLVVWSSVVASG